MSNRKCKHKVVMIIVPVPWHRDKSDSWQCLQQAERRYSTNEGLEPMTGATSATWCLHSQKWGCYTEPQRILQMVFIGLWTDSLRAVHGHRWRRSLVVRKKPPPIILCHFSTAWYQVNSPWIDPLFIMKTSSKRYQVLLNTTSFEMVPEERR